MLRTTYTVVQLEISQEAFNEIYNKLLDAGYDHAFHEEDGRIMIDMHGIALIQSEE